jgi:hypothetical protein
MRFSAAINAPNCRVCTIEKCIYLPADPLLYYGPHTLAVNRICGTGPNACSGINCTWSGGGTVTLTGTPC